MFDSENDHYEDSSMDNSGELQPSRERPLVDVRGVHVTFGHQHVLRGINLQIPRRQNSALIGESGCGKTVLMKTIIGLVRPTRGTVRFDGLELHKLNDRDLSRHRLRFGFVFQNAALFDSMTIGQNISFPLRQQQTYTPQEIREIVMTRLAQVGLPESVLRKKPAELSGGMRKRVGLARALVLNPEIVLYDEPTTGLDPIMSDVINELILRTRDRDHVTSVVVTHDMKSARKVADRVIMVYPVARLSKTEPQVLYDGPPDGLDQVADRRVRQFTEGEAGERLMEMRREAELSGITAF
jgi:phospholipid/cholesterol/gamma-HCH transport system ATP-binding protein